MKLVKIIAIAAAACGLMITASCCCLKAACCLKLPAQDASVEVCPAK